MVSSSAGVRRATDVCDRSSLVLDHRLRARELTSVFAVYVAMTKRTLAAQILAGMLITCASFAQLSAVSGTSPVSTDDSVKVTVKYTGKGDVDKMHKLWVWLFDTPDIGPGAIPIAEMSLDENGGIATFPTVSAQKVWIAVAFDEKGGFSGSAPPPTGSPVALYGADSGAPSPVTPGAEANVTVTFDDSQRMQ